MMKAAARRFLTALLMSLFGAAFAPAMAQVSTFFVYQQNTFNATGDYWYKGFTVSGTGTQRFVLRFTSDYACDAAVIAEGELDNFINNRSFSGYALFDDSIGTSYITLAAGSYYVCARAQSDGENPYRVELDYGIVIPDDGECTYAYYDCPMNEATFIGSDGGQLTHGFTIQSGFRYLIDGCNSGVEVYIIPASELSAFQSDGAFEYYVDYSSPEANGANPGLFDLNLPPGDYYLACINRTSVDKAIVYTMERWRQTLKPVSMTVYFDPQGGAVSPTSKTVTRGATYGALPTPTRAGYAFGGWWTGAGGTGAQADSSMTVTVTGNHTLYAKWMAVAAPTIATASPLPYATEGTPYGSLGFSATGGLSPYAWSLAAGSLPSGMTLSSKGVLSGTPSGPGAFGFTVRVTGGNGQSSTKAFSLAVAAMPALSVAPANRNVTMDAGSVTFGISNVGGGSLMWSATVTSGGSWASLSGSPGQLTVTYTANPSGGGIRKATIRVTADGAKGSPVEVTVTQEANTHVEAYAATVGVALEVDLFMMAGAAQKVTVTGLPLGLKYNATSRKVEGVPLEAGVFTVRVFASGNLLGTLSLTVAALPAWAQGAFNGFYANGGLVSMTVSSAGKVAGKVTAGGVSYAFAAASFAPGGSAEAGFTCATVAKAGKVSIPLSLRVTQAGASGLPSLGYAVGDFGSAASALRMWSNVWPSVPSTLAPILGYYTATLPGNESYGSGYLTFTVSGSGGFKAAGKLADGTPVSMAGTLVMDAVGTVVAVVYASPASYKGGHLFGLASFERPPGGAVSLDTVDVGWPFEWYCKNPQATGTQGNGFYRELGLSGGWYSKTANLAAHYAGKTLTAGVDPDAPAPELTVGAVRYDSIWWDPSGVALTPTLKSGVMAGLAAPAAGKTTDADKDGTWDYGAANTAGLKITFSRATGVFKGSFLAWFDYPVKKHVSKSLAFEGALTPVRENPLDGVEGRGFFLWADKAVPPLPAKPYAFKWSYDFKILLAE